MKMYKNLMPAVALTMFVSLCFLAGCENKGPVEKLGADIDETVDDAKRNIEDATD